MPITTRTILVALALAACGGVAHGATIFVNASAPAGGTGASWASARNDLRAALQAANAGDEVWIARGMYKPNTLLDRGLRFTVKSGVKVYGGFAGGETSIAQRPADNDLTAADPAFDTIISGEIGAPGPSDNTTVVVDMNSTNTATLLDRVVVMDGANTSGFCGGVSLNTSAATVSNCLILNNTAGGGGGMWIEFGNNAQVLNCVFKGNTAPDAGALLIRQGSATVRGSAFLSNSASSTGGAISLAFSGSVLIENSTFRQNFGGGSGGGAIRAVLSSSVTVRDSLFDGNSASPPPTASGGGALNFNNASILAERCTFVGSSASQGGVYDHQGGGSAIFRNCTFRENTASFGGAMNLPTAGALIEDSLFEANSASTGGAIINSSTYTATRCIFRNNTATTGPSKNGGALYLWNSATLNDCTFDGNSANVGGAVYMTGGASAFQRCTFVRQTTTASGGVIFNVAGSGTYSNCLFAKNTGQIFGSVLLHGGSAGASTFNNCTIVDNSGASQAFTVFNGSFALNNSIVRNAGDEFGGSITPAVSYSNVEGGFAGTGNISAAPTFVDSASNNYKLASGSAGIDAGSNALVAPNTTGDLAGDERLRDDPAIADSGVGPGPVIDMGAYEFQPAAPLPCVGDANGDRAVNFSDITSVLTSFGNTGSPFIPGDADGSGDVTFGDITSVLTNFGNACP